MKRTKIVSIIVTYMETLLPMSVGMSMHRFSPGRSRARLYMFLMVVIIILLKTMTFTFHVLRRR